MARLFVAVFPGESVLDELRRVPRTDRRVRWMGAERWHVTLRFLGDADRDAVTELLDGADLVPAEARFGPTVELLGDRVVIVPVAGLDRLAATVAGSLEPLALPVELRPFRGHLTLGRLRRPGSVPSIVGRPLTAIDAVDEIALVQSSPVDGVATYRIVGRWRFADGGLSR